MAQTGATRGTGADSAPLDPPSVVQMAQDRIRGLILSGEVGPGDRLGEERLCERLGISRPPLREALRLLQHEGLVVTRPRKGSFVATLTDRDVHEILTLRSGLERLAIELGVPVRDPERLRVCWQALDRMQAAAKDQDRAALVQAGYAFHSAVVALADHGRLHEIYTSLQQQLLLCMARNLYAREHYFEDLEHHVERHRHLLRLIEAGDPKAVLAELAVHGERSFVSVGLGAGGAADDTGATAGTATGDADTERAGSGSEGA